MSAECSMGRSCYRLCSGLSLQLGTLHIHLQTLSSPPAAFDASMDLFYSCDCIFQLSISHLFLVYFQFFVSFLLLSSFLLISEICALSACS